MKFPFGHSTSASTKMTLVIQLIAFVVVLALLQNLNASLRSVVSAWVTLG